MPRHIKSHDPVFILSNITTYEVFCNGPLGVHLHPRDLCDMDRKGTLADLASGQFDDVVLIRESNIAEGTIRIATEDMLREAGLLDEEPNTYNTLSGNERQLIRWDHERDLRKHSEVV